MSRKKSRNTINSKVKFVVSLGILALLLTSCSNTSGGNASPSVQPDWPLTSLPEGVNVQPALITDDRNVLKKSLEAYELVSEIGDYSQFNVKGLKVVETFAEGNSDISLNFRAPQIILYKDGTSDIDVLFTIDSRFGGKSICNGIIFEVAGEAFKVPDPEGLPCSDTTNDLDTDYAGWRVGSYSSNTALFSAEDVSENLEMKRLFLLLSQNSFVIRLNHSRPAYYDFVFDLNREDPSPQDFLSTAFEAEKAISLGLDR